MQMHVKENYIEKNSLLHHRLFLFCYFARVSNSHYQCG